MARLEGDATGELIHAPGYGLTLAFGETLPTGQRGFAPGCIFDLVGAGGSVVPYVNTGTADNAEWSALARVSDIAAESSSLQALIDELKYAPVLVPVDAGTVIAVGDLVYLDAGKALPASAAEDLESESANQAFLHDGFIGVALDATANGQTDPIRVATRGRFTFSCAALTFVVGDMIGGKEAAGGTQLENQVVTKVDATNIAIGRAAESHGTSTTSILVDIVSTIMYGGPMPPPAE